MHNCAAPSFALTNLRIHNSSAILALYMRCPMDARGEREQRERKAGQGQPEQGSPGELIQAQAGRAAVGLPTPVPEPTGVDSVRGPAQVYYGNWRKTWSEIAMNFV